MKIYKVNFPKDSLHPDLIINDRISDLIQDYSRQDLKLYFEGGIVSNAFGLDVQIENLVLTYGQDKVEEIMNMFFSNIKFYRKVG